MSLRTLVCSSLVAAALAGGACGSETSSTPAPAAATAAPTAPVPAPYVTRVADNRTVCMINNMDMDRPQIPVQVGDRTYYGCCESCKQRLTTDATSRVAKDPVTGEDVDKATAVIGRTRSGNVFYFASADHLEQFARR